MIFQLKKVYKIERRDNGIVNIAYEWSSDLLPVVKNSNKPETFEG